MAVTKLLIRKPWHPVAWDVAEVSAIQAIARGEATPEQQKRALDCIINRIAETYDEPFQPDSERETQYALGKAKVGRELVKAVKINIAKYFDLKGSREQQ